MSLYIVNTINLCQPRKKLRLLESMTRFVLTILMAAMVLAGCNSMDPTTDEATMEEAAKLALGTINLEGTDQAVNAELASRLLPLWQLMSDMSISSTAATEELAAVVDELEATMTAGQLSAIESMEIPETEIAAATQGNEAASVTDPGGAGTGSQPVVAAMDPALGSEFGGDTAGGMPLDGGMPMDGGAPGSAQADPGFPRSSSSNALFARVIDLLESKLQS